MYLYRRSALLFPFSLTILTLIFIVTKNSIPMAVRYSQEETLTSRLRGLLEIYPPGVSTLKELLQNADDAGAKNIVPSIHDSCNMLVLFD